jgi:N-acyl homoserine lactone hydrolase
VTDVNVRRVNFGWFVRPAEESETGVSRVEPLLGYLIEHPAGALLVDTGMGSHPEIDEHYRPARVGLREALAQLGLKADDIRYVVNCHLHFDHCGGNPLLSGRPVFTQRAELTAAREVPDYTLPELIDHPGVQFEQLDGEAEILPGVRILPTPGHTAGHQSVVVTRSDGTLVVAGQSHDNATLFTGDVLAHHAHLGKSPTWLTHLLSFDPRQVLFAHDNAIWTP